MREGVGWRVVAVCAPRPARDHLLGELPQLEPGVGVLRERDEVVVRAVQVQDDRVDLPHHVLPPRPARQREVRAAGRTRGRRKTPSYKTDSLITVNLGALDRPARAARTEAMKKPQIVTQIASMVSATELG